MSRTAVIVGAGPAGLTAACELLRSTEVVPIVFEMGEQVGGISRTINYRGNRMDLGGHRFFSKSDWVMNWWQSVLPVAASAEDVGNDAAALRLTYQGAAREFTPAARADHQRDDVLLVRSRLSRIFYRRRFFDYPLKLNLATLANLGAPYTAAIGASYLAARMNPRRPELTLEDFLVNRFGDTLYRTFFKDYTEKVWGVPCAEISAEWGAQRIKGLSISKAIAHALAKPFRSRDTAQKSTETSLVERFLYPKLGPGQMWEHVAARVVAAGGEVHLRHRVVGVERTGERITGVAVRDTNTGEVRRVACDQLISTMPVKELADLLQPADPEVSRIASQLPYRDFMTAGLLVRRMRGGHRGAVNGMPPDNWIYIQEPDVKLGRLQIFNNWSPALVADPDTIWLGLEYFCAQGDALWSMADAAFLSFAAAELAKIGLIAPEDVLDGTVVRVPKAYPAYFGAYGEIARVRDWLDTFPNLFPVGRNGMHRYNNQDHSMLAARAAVECIASGHADKAALWAVNVEDEYHESARRKG
ncbi:MAG TPA: NAD(P)/FAD-dependent oxidoreductase [Steroidobacteraceae bacterium]|nr:NAD(P)/FAD-dependent oxidoreductase [Steroidobacteraceae bacterium]